MGAADTGGFTYQYVQQPQNVIDMYQCEKCQVWSIYQKCQCGYSKETSSTEKI